MKNGWKKACSSEWIRAEKILANDGVAVIPTDTLYGIVGRAESKKAVAKVSKIKNRKENSPYIILVTSYKQIEEFGIKINENQAKFLEKIWPGKVSVIIPCKIAKWKYLHLGQGSLAFRMIGKKNSNLFRLITRVGALVAPSANRSGDKPAESIVEAKKYFGDEVDFYINKGKKKSVPSTLIKYDNNEWIVLRQGVRKII